MSKKTVGIYTLGCRLNIYESDGLLNQFIQNGFDVVDWKDGPDVAIINTCTVTSFADQKNRTITKQILKKNPKTKVIITGCYAQTDNKELQKIPGIWAIIGNEKKSQLFNIYKELENSKSQLNVFSSGPLDYFETSKKRKQIQDPFSYGNVIPVGHTRAYLKIQDGCDRKCSYCKIPQARGGGVSRPIESILEQVEILEEYKVPEIVLTGVNLGWYRYNNYRFTDLLEIILNKLRHSRLRLSSIEPSDVNEKLAELLQHSKICNFLHVPVQSGSDRILKLMKRSYTSKTFSLRIEKVLKKNPNIFLGTDIMVGFPSETQKDFNDTLKLLQNLNFVNIHPFPFSLRQGTDIEQYVLKYPEHIIKKEVVQERIHHLINFKNNQLIHYASNQLNKIFKGIVEEINTNYYKTLTENYLNIQVKKQENIKRGDVLNIKLIQITTDFTKQKPVELFGEII